MFTPPCFPPRHQQVCGIASIGPSSNERLAAWTMRAGPPHLSLPSGRCWHEEIPTKRRSTWCCAEAFDQEAKNAWKVEDFPTIEAATRNALVAACTALRLEPRNTAARMKVAGLQDKIVGLASRRPPPQ